MIAPWHEATVALYAAMLHDRVHFAQTAYGDGEWMCILGEYPKRNANNETFSPELGRALAKSLMEPTGQWCCLWPEGAAATKIRRMALGWIAEHKPAVRWLPFRPFGWANQEGRMAPIFRAWRTRRVLLIGPQHLSAVPETVIQPARHIVVADTAASRFWEETVAAVLPVLEPDDLVIVAAGMCANLIVHRLNGMFREQATFIDVGALLDPYAGVYSRRIYRDTDWRVSIMPENLAA